MKHWLRALTPLSLFVGLAACTSMTGSSTGRSIDDTAITTAVKSKMTGDRAGALTAVDVDTVGGTVYLSGTVPDSAAKQRAGQLARQVSGVVAVENDLETGSAAAGDAPSGDAPRMDGDDTIYDEEGAR